MTLTTKLSALTTAGIMVVIGVPMVTQSARDFDAEQGEIDQDGPIWEQP